MIEATAKEGRNWPKAISRVASRVVSGPLDKNLNHSPTCMCALAKCLLAIFSTAKQQLLNGMMQKSAWSISTFKGWHTYLFNNLNFRAKNWKLRDFDNFLVKIYKNLKCNYFWDFCWKKLMIFGVKIPKHEKWHKNWWFLPEIEKNQTEIADSDNMFCLWVKSVVKRKFTPFLIKIFIFQNIQVWEKKYYC